MEVNDLSRKVGSMPYLKATSQLTFLRKRDYPHLKECQLFTFPNIEGHSKGSGKGPAWDSHISECPWLLLGLNYQCI